MNLQVEYMPIGQLRPYAGNAKEHPEWQIEQIEESIETFGFCDPVGVVTNPDGTLTIMEGHGRVLAESKRGPTMKPVDLMGRSILNSTKPGEAVLDPFGGSGSALIACEQSGRKCYTIELDPHYCDVILERWERETGREAVLDEQE